MNSWNSYDRYIIKTLSSTNQSVNELTSLVTKQFVLGVVVIFILEGLEFQEQGILDGHKSRIV